MKYVTRIYAIGKYPEIAIDEEIFLTIKRAKRILSDALSIEQKFEMLLSNYLDLEKEIVTQATELLVRQPQDYDDFFISRTEFNRRLVNLLTATRLYVDQVKHHSKAILGEKNEEEINSLFSTEYDSYFEYEFMEALRNYVQHCGFPIHRISYSNYCKDEIEDRPIVHSMELFSEKRYLAEDKQFKAKTLKKCPDQVNVKLATRVYIECLSRVQSSLRSKIEETVNSSRNIIYFEYIKYRKVYGKKPIGLAAMKMDEREVCTENIPLLLDWDDIRIRLQKRNTELKNLRKRYASGEIKKT